MSKDTSPQMPIVQKRETTDYIIIPPRRSVRVEDGDWERWIRNIKKIPKRGTYIRDIMFTCIGIALPLLYDVVVTWRSSSIFPSSDLVFPVLLLVLAGVCWLFDRERGDIALSNIDEVLQDMQEVHQRAARSEERAFDRNLNEELVIL